MDLFEAIAKRHSYRGSFTAQNISHENLQRIVEAGLLAPSGCNGQTTSFVIVEQPDLVSQIRQMHKSNKAMQQAQAYIACIIDMQPQAVYEGHSFQVEDCATAVENMLLAVTAIGYATVWVDGWLRVNDNARLISELLNVPPGKVIRVILPVGVPADLVLAREKKPFGERAWFNSYEPRNGS